jgi:hypothetical protein
MGDIAKVGGAGEVGDVQFKKLRSTGASEFERLQETVISK